MTLAGLRPGEKLYEELLVKTEELDKTPNSMIFIERDSGSDNLEFRNKQSTGGKAEKDEISDKDPEGMAGAENQKG